MPEEIFRNRTPRIHMIELVGEPREIEQGRMPEGYHMFNRQLRLLSGGWAPAFYSIGPSEHENQDGEGVNEFRLDPADAEQRVAPSLIAGFVWALEVAEFIGEQAIDADRAMEIGNMMSYAIARGLTESRVFECYVDAFNIACESQ